MVIDYLSRMSTIQGIYNYRYLSRSPMHYPIQGLPYHAHTGFPMCPFQPAHSRPWSRCPMPNAGVPDARVLHGPCLMQGCLMQGCPHAQCRGAPWWCGVCVFGCVCDVCVCVCVWFVLEGLPCESPRVQIVPRIQIVSSPALLGLWPSPSGRTL